MNLIKKINLYERLRKYRKELEKIFKIPEIKKENKILIKHLKDANDKIEELKQQLEFEKTNKQRTQDRNVKLINKVNELEEELEEK